MQSGQEKCSQMTRANIHSTRSPPCLRWLLTASRSQRFHSRVSSPCAASQCARITTSSSVRVNLTVCGTWPLCGKKSGSDKSSALGCVMGVAGANRPPRLDMANGTDIAALGKVGASRFRSMSRSSSESRSRWLISEKPVKELL
jgi:hypothetical protein